MKRSFSVIMVLLVALAFASVAGCTNGGNGNSGTELKQLNFGYQPSTHQVAYMIAMDKGWWGEALEKHGYTAAKSKNEYQFATGAPEIQSMLAGEIDVAYVGSAPVLSGIANGLDAKIVAAVQTQGSGLVVGKNVEYKGPESLKGKIIATFPEGTIQDTLIRKWLSANNIDPDKDVDIRGMGSGDAITALTAGSVDAIFVPAPSPTIAEEDGIGKIVVWSGEMEENHGCCVLIVSGKLIREHPELVTDIVKTHIRASDYSTAHLDEAAEVFAGYTKNTKDIIEKSFNNWDGKWVSDPKLIEDSVMNYVKEQVKLGYLKEDLPADSIFDFRFYEAATAKA